MKAKLRRFARAAAYPAFYLFCLALFGYLTFPFDALGSRLVAEFDKSQQATRRSPTKAPMELELGELDGYWLTGLEVHGAKITIPPDTKPKRAPGPFGRGPLGGGTATRDDNDKSDEPAAKPTVVTVDHGHARVRLLPLLLGRVRIDFGADVFGGEVWGTLPYGGNSGDVEVEIEGVKLGEVEPLSALLGLPVLGEVSGQLQVTPVEGKFSKADGKLELRIERIVIGDGKATLQGLALPAAQLGDLVITGTAKDGVLKIEEISTSGKDLELQGEGRIRMREPWLRSQADIFLRFRFSDAYRNKDDMTRSLLGAPGSNMPPAIEFDARVKRSKREDGFYAWHVHGALADLQFDPQGPQSKGARTRTSTPSVKTPAGGRSTAPSISSRVGRRGLASKSPAASRSRGQPSTDESPAGSPPAEPEEANQPPEPEHEPPGQEAPADEDQPSEEPGQAGGAQGEGDAPTGE